MQELYVLVGSHDSVNPRNFQVLISDGPIPTEHARVNGLTIRQAGLSVLTVLIGENWQVQSYDITIISYNAYPQESDEHDEPQESEIITIPESPVPETPDPLTNISNIKQLMTCKKLIVIIGINKNVIIE